MRKVYYDAEGWIFFCVGENSTLKYRIYKDRKYVCIIYRNSIGNFWGREIRNPELYEVALGMLKNFLGHSVAEKVKTNPCTAPVS